MTVSFEGGATLVADVSTNEQQASSSDGSLCFELLPDATDPTATIYRTPEGEDIRVVAVDGEQVIACPDGERASRESTRPSSMRSTSVR